MLNASEVAKNLKVIQDDMGMYEWYRALGFGETIADAIRLIESLTAVPIDPCPGCGKPPIVVEEIDAELFSIGCRQVFIRRAPDEEVCPEPVAMMQAGDRGKTVAAWNMYCEQKRGA